MPPFCGQSIDRCVGDGQAVTLWLDVAACGLRLHFVDDNIVIRFETLLGALKYDPMNVLSAWQKAVMHATVTPTKQ